MARTKTIKDLEQKVVNHAELHALVTHLSAINAAIEVRLGELERVVNVNPEVGESAAAFLARLKAQTPEIVRTLALVQDGDAPEGAA